MRRDGDGSSGSISKPAPRSTSKLCIMRSTIRCLRLVMIVAPVKTSESLFGSHMPPTSYGGVPSGGATAKARKEAKERSLAKRARSKAAKRAKSKQSAAKKAR